MTIQDLKLRLSGLKTLTEGQRELAWDKSRDSVAGPPVSEFDFEPITPPPLEPSQYPPVMVIGVVLLVIVVLVAAFIPSGMRLYLSGDTVFCEGVQSFVTSPEQFDEEGSLRWWCKAVGYAVVFQSEIGQAIALLSIAVLGTNVGKADDDVEKATKVSNRIFWGIAILTTLIAYVGNLNVARPWAHGNNLFAWLLDLAPPTIVIGAMYSLKELMLYFIRRRHRRNMVISELEQERSLRIHQARTIRQKYLDQPETHPQWLRVYPVTIRDLLQKDNSSGRGAKDRVELMKSLTIEEWKYLVKQEILSGQFIVDPNKETKVELVERELQEAYEFREKAEAPSPEVELWENEDGTWTAKCTECGVVLGTAYKKQHHGKNALSNHHRSEQKRKEASNG